MLPEQTVQVVQPAFYPGAPLCGAGCARGSATPPDPAVICPLDVAIDLAADGATLVQVELPSRITGEVDGEAADTLVALALSLFRRGVRIWDDGRDREITPRMIGIVCAHVPR